MKFIPIKYTNLKREIKHRFSLQLLLHIFFFLHYNLFIHNHLVIDLFIYQFYIHMGFLINQILSSPSLINIDTCFRIIRYENTHPFIKSRYSKIENQKTLYLHKQTTKNASCNVSKL